MRLKRIVKTQKLVGKVGLMDMTRNNETLWHPSLDRYERYVMWAKIIGKKDIMSRAEYMYELWMGNLPPLAPAPDG